nr:collagen alpha-1(I) chain-like [Aegilops tauschii subsp. strangulata]
MAPTALRRPGDAGGVEAGGAVGAAGRGEAEAWTEVRASGRQAPSSPVAGFKCGGDGGSGMGREPLLGAFGGGSLRAGRRRAFAPGGRGARQPRRPGRASLRSVAEQPRPLAGREVRRAETEVVAAAPFRKVPGPAPAPVAGAAAPAEVQEVAAVSPDPWPRVGADGQIGLMGLVAAAGHSGLAAQLTPIAEGGAPVTGAISVQPRPVPRPGAQAREGSAHHISGCGSAEAP